MKILQKTEEITRAPRTASPPRTTSRYRVHESWEKDVYADACMKRRRVLNVCFQDRIVVTA